MDNDFLVWLVRLLDLDRLNRQVLFDAVETPK